MISDIMKLVGKFVNIFKKPLYGKTFKCPICHLELSEHDTDENGCMVCPLCSVVIELHETYGHFLPIVNDVEVERVQPKAKLHPLATHLPIGLMPLALLGAVFLLLASIYLKIAGISVNHSMFLSDYSATINNVTLIMLIIAVGSSALTFLTGFVDWRYRFSGRSYRVITLKIILSTLFLIIGAVSIALHFVIFNGGIIALDNFMNIVAVIFYFGFMSAAMFMLATLGHVGGYLVFGK